MDIKKIAALAQVGLNDAESKKFSDQLSAILAYFDQIKAIDTTGIVPLVTPSDIELKLRKDEAQTWDRGDEALAQAPEISGKLFKVPPVVG